MKPTVVLLLVLILSSGLANSQIQKASSTTLPSEASGRSGITPGSSLVVVKRFVVRTEDGLQGFSVGKKVTLVREVNGEYFVTDGQIQGKASIEFFNRVDQPHDAVNVSPDSDHADANVEAADAESEKEETDMETLPDEASRIQTKQIEPDPAPPVYPTINPRSEEPKPNTEHDKGVETAIAIFVSVIGIIGALIAVLLRSGASLKQSTGAALGLVLFVALIAFMGWIGLLVAVILIAFGWFFSSIKQHNYGRPIFVSSAIVAFLALCTILIYQFVGVFVIQPIGAVPKGVTILYWRHGTKMPFITSADGILISLGSSVSLLGRGIVLAKLLEPIKDREIIRLEYSDLLYQLSTGGRIYEK